MDRIKNYALELCKIYAPSSDEGKITSVLAQKLESMGYNVEHTPLRSVIAYRGSKSNKKIMLSAHCDTIGVMATYIDGAYVSFAPLGSVSLIGLAGTYVEFANGAKGVIGCKKNDGSDKLTVQDFYIDMGQDASGLVKQGDCAMLCGETFIKDEKLYSPSADNRICCAVLLDIAESIDRDDVCFAFTARNKLGAKGAYGAYFELSPNIAIELSVSDAQDIPGGKKNIKLGEGAVLRITHGSYTSDMELIDSLEACAERSQREAVNKDQSEMAAFASVNGASKSCSVGISCRRYSNTAVAVSLKDAEILKNMIEKYI